MKEIEDTPRQAVIRVAKTLVVYAVVAGPLWMSVPSIRRTFLLPQLFGPLMAVMLVLGVPIAVAIAWRYPRLGSGTSGEG